MKLIDSSAWVEFLRKRGDPAVKQAVARIMQANLAAFTCPVWFELLSGARPEEEDDLTQALAFSRHVPFEREDWPAAALLERRMRAQGVTIPRNDLFVVTVAIRTGLTVICRDQHFETARQVSGNRLNVDQL
jgi:predicted nucleic acid-binding protein